MSFNLIVFTFLIIGHKSVSGLNVNRNYSDTCAYHSTNYYYNSIQNSRSNYQFLCGDICLFRDPVEEDRRELCTCGGERIQDSDHYCCTPASDKCNKTQDGALCPHGRVLSVDTKSPMRRCHSNCYNDYLTSAYLGQHAHYPCPHMCVDWKDWCQGVSFCDNDEKVCGEDLRCPQDEGTKYTIANITPVRSYCHRHGTANDNAYDTIDRTDEDVFKAARERINYTELQPCFRLGIPGTWCGGVCVWNQQWCSDESPNYCEHAGIYTNDTVLCSNHTFWKNITCTQYFNRSLIVQGKFRCKGAIQHCYWPKSNNDDWPKTCRDLSDRVFDVGQPCSDTPDDICWDSCKKPGLKCTACTNSTYFNCYQSNTCIHPSLYCDGHPQCEHGEDEDLDKCKTEYTKNNLIPETATFRCRSIMYPIMETYATACDGLEECFEAEDEKFCSGYSVLKKILVSTSLIIVILYQGLKFGRIAKQKFEKKTFDLKNLGTSWDLHSDILQTYSENHGDSEVVEKLNTFLLHIMFSRTIDVTEAYYRKLYTIEESIHNSDKAEIYSCLHQHFDPLIMKKVDESQFKGLEQKFIDFIEAFFKQRFITEAKNFIISHEWLMVILRTLTKLVKIEIKYLDLLKDLSLAFSLFFIVGGFQAIQDFDINFSIGIVLCLMTTVLLPIFFATVHLAIHNPYLIFGESSGKMMSSGRKTLMIVFCCLSSIFNPILLINAYESAKENTRLLAKAMDRKVF